MADEAVAPVEKDAPDYLIRVIERAGVLLELIRQTPDGAALPWLAAQSGLSKPTVFRLARNLEYLGLVEWVASTKSYRLGPQCAVLGQAYLEQVDVLSAGKAALRSLRDDTGETTHLGVLDRAARVVYLEKLEGTHAVGITMSRVGRTGPSYCTGVGKVVLAHGAPELLNQVFAGRVEPFTDSTITDRLQLEKHLEAVRARGYSLDLEEHERGVRCVAVPVRDSTGAVVAGISVTGPSTRMTIDRLEGPLLERARSAASEVSRRLGWSGRLSV